MTIDPYTPPQSDLRREVQQVTRGPLQWGLLLLSMCFAIVFGFFMDAVSGLFMIGTLPALLALGPLLGLVCLLVGAARSFYRPVLGKVWLACALLLLGSLFIWTFGSGILMGGAFFLIGLVGACLAAIGLVAACRAGK